TDGDGSHGSTSKTPSYTKSVSWHHYLRGYISGLMENWLFAPQSFDLKKEARDYVAILLEMYLLCPTLRNPATNE
ncbi:hypothetical protein RNN08_19735, partial [Escherichia coli]|nr:hypothetical protein [Escherichia coli]